MYISTWRKFFSAFLWNYSKIYAQNFTDEILSITDLENEVSLIFTNPVSDSWNVKSSNSIEFVTVYNILGQPIFKENYFGKNEIIINTQNWNSGIYIIKLTSNKGLISKQVIKK